MWSYGVEGGRHNNGHSPSSTYCLILTFSISTERHRAEVRRAVNDEKLATIADKWVRPDSS